MADDIGRIGIQGMKEFSRSLRALDAQLPKGLRDAGNRAADLVVAVARPRVPVGPPAGGHARSSLRAASTRTAARVRAGGKRFSYFPWLDFGGKVGRNDTASRPFLKEGRYIWKSYAEHRDAVELELRDALTELARTSGLRVRVR